MSNTKYLQHFLVCALLLCVTKAYSQGPIPPGPATPGSVPSAEPENWGSSPAPLGSDYNPAGTPASKQTLSQGGYLPSDILSFDKMTALRLSYLWLPQNGTDTLGLHDIRTSVTIALPEDRFLGLLPDVTPWFGLGIMSGPSDSRGIGEMPGQVFDTGLRCDWKPQFFPEGHTLHKTIWAELSLGLGVYSSFDKIDSKAFRFTGQGVVAAHIFSRWSARAGVRYYDRNRAKLMPVGGLIYYPYGDSPDKRRRTSLQIHFLFPDPQIRMRLPGTRNSPNRWLYLRGEWGGNCWAVNRAAGGYQRVDYNDYRFALGFEALGATRLDFGFEVGVAFSRELYYEKDPKAYSMGSTVFLGGNVIW